VSWHRDSKRATPPHQNRQNQSAVRQPVERIWFRSPIGHGSPYTRYIRPCPRQGAFPLRSKPSRQAVPVALGQHLIRCLLTAPSSRAYRDRSLCQTRSGARQRAAAPPSLLGIPSAGPNTPPTQPISHRQPALRTPLQKLVTTLQNKFSAPQTHSYQPPADPSPPPTRFRPSPHPHKINPRAHLRGDRGAGAFPLLPQAICRI